MMLLKNNLHLMFCMILIISIVELWLYLGSAGIKNILFKKEEVAKHDIVSLLNKVTDQISITSRLIRNLDYRQRLVKINKNLQKINKDYNVSSLLIQQAELVNNIFWIVLYG